MKINAFKCPNCGDLIFSRAIHDFRRCSCKTIAIDGGFEYHKLSFQDELPELIEIELNVTRKELYDDWNIRIDKYGVIKSNEKNI